MWHRWTVVIERGQRRFKSPVLLSPLLSLLPNSGPERLARRCGLLLASPFFPLRPAFLAFWSSTSRPIYKFTLLLLSFHGPVVTMCVRAHPNHQRRLERNWYGAPSLPGICCVTGWQMLNALKDCRKSRRHGGTLAKRDAAGHVGVREARYSRVYSSLLPPHFLGSFPTCWTAPISHLFFLFLFLSFSLLSACFVSTWQTSRGLVFAHQKGD